MPITATYSCTVPDASFAVTACSASCSSTCDWRRADLVCSSGGTSHITVKNFAPDTPGTYTNQALVDPDNTIPEGDELNNQASVNTVVTNGGNGAFNDLQIAKTGSATTTPGGPISYTLTVSNTGSDAALNVSVRDVLPAGETFDLANPHDEPFEAVAVMPVGGRATLPGGEPFVPPWAQ